MIELNLSVKSSQLNVTSYQATTERNTLNVQVGGNNPTPSALNNQEQQIVDQVGISPEALQKFEDAKLLANQLQNYSDYLNGKNKGQGGNVRLVANDNKPDVTISGQSTQLSASYTLATYYEETLDVSAQFDDDGNLQSLSIDQSKISATYEKAELILNDSQFYLSA